MKLQTLKKLERAAWRMMGAFDEAERKDSNAGKDSNAAYREVADLWQRYYKALKQRDLALFDADAAKCTLWTVYRPMGNGAMREVVRTQTRHCSSIRWDGKAAQNRCVEHRGARGIDGDFRRAMDWNSAA